MAAAKPGGARQDLDLEPVPLPIGFGLSGSNSQSPQEEEEGDPGQDPEQELLSGLESGRPLSLRAKPNRSLVQEFKTFDVGNSQVLSRVAQFLPQMQQANERLNQEIQVLGREAFDIEQVGAEGTRIEMDLSLGVLELQPKDKDETTEEAERRVQSVLGLGLLSQAGGAISPMIQLGDLSDDEDYDDSDSDVIQVSEVDMSDGEEDEGESSGEE